ncbi:MAG: hypothetical protein BIFFINMI_01734 [Phycisphaerae bacterium]|nr:hypothetical protein [Phycisphaerae bacterium]
MRNLFLRCLVPCLLPALAMAADAPTTASALDPQAGPAGPKTPPALWGVAVRDEVNDEWLWFGGAGGLSKTGPLNTWILKDGQWRQAQFNPPAGLPASSLAEQTGALRDLYAAVANRYYRCETEKVASVDLAKRGGELADRIAAAFKDTPAGAAPQLDALKSQLASLVGRLAKGVTVKEVADAREVWMSAEKLAMVSGDQPAPRNMPAMAYDAKTKSIILFGGEGIFGVYADTWVYDCAKRQWRNARPGRSPTPRLSAGLVARDGVAYLVGGQEARGSMSYCAGLWARLPFDVWAYDIAANTWTRLSAGEGTPQPTTCQPAVVATFSDNGKTLNWSAGVNSYGKIVKTLTGSLALPAGDADTAKVAVAWDAIQVRGEGFDPAWYEAVQAPEPEKFQAFLKALPANRWTDVNPPKLHVSRDWGTTVLDVAGDQLLHWAGGHSSHCGTDVAHYSPALNRWHILYTPELPMGYCYSNDGAPAPTLSGAPWGPHSYLSYGWDQVTGLMIWAGEHAAYRLTNPAGTWTYDPAAYRWSSPQFSIEGGTFDVERHKTCMVRTPHGLAVWADKYGGSGLRTGLWMADVAHRVYRPVAGTDPKDSTTLPPPAFGDRHGMTYDSKRDRVLIFHFGIKDKSRVWAVDLASREVAVLTPKGSDRFPDDASVGREATYVPSADVVIVCSSGKPAQHTLIYDCAADAWGELPGAFATDAKGRTEPGYGVSTGVEYDPKRDLLWLVQTNGAVFAMRFDKTAVRPLGK